MFVDDLLLISPHLNSILAMLKDLKPKLLEIGLELNELKTAYITTSPALASRLPGSNQNKEGMKILGRIFKLSENTTQEEMTAKIGAALAKYARLRNVLRAKTPIEHRLRIMKACIGQTMLWGCETWHVTRRNLQRVRRAEMKILRSMIPPPPENDQQTVSQKIEAHKAHIRTILEQKQYLPLDRVWLKRFYVWAGHTARLPEQRWAKRALL